MKEIYTKPFIEVERFECPSVVLTGSVPEIEEGGGELD